MKENSVSSENEKKQVPLRISTKLYDALAKWADDDFRSVNGQIEYLLTECVRQRKKNGKSAVEEAVKANEAGTSFSNLGEMKKSTSV